MKAIVDAPAQTIKEPLGLLTILLTVELKPCQSDLQTPLVAFMTIQTCKFLDPKEESILDLDAEIYETVLTLGNLTKIR